ncbi:MAG TPA: tetratricopeptide repeat protein [Anaerohalosphaeraceae bacterium]|nr:tetratricopeptide repeat protein [Anaerohalosphaeraceae bacterium]
MTESSYYEDDSSLNGWEQAEQRVAEAYEFYESGQMQDALDKLNEAVTMNPGCVAWHFNRGLTLDAMDRYEEAIACYQQALELAPSDAEILNCLAVDYTRTVQYDLAVATFEKIETIDPSYEPAYCNWIIAYTEMEQHDKAEQMFYMAQQINPECPICFYNIGNSLFSRGNYVRAIWCWEKTAELEPTHPQIHYRIAQACWADGQINKAKDYFLRELRRNPGHIDVLADYGVFLLEQGHISQAAEKFRWILELRPEFAQAMFYLGEICRLEENLDEAMAWYTKAKTTETQLAGPRFRMAQIRLWQDQPDGVAELLRDEIKLACDDEQIMLSIGQMLIRLGEYNDALPCFLRVLDSNSEQGRAYFGISAILMHRRDLEGCLQFLEHAIGVDVRVLSAYLGAALIHTRQNNYQRAFQILHKAKSLLGNSWRLRIWMAKVWICRLRYATTHRFFPKHQHGD